MDSAQYHLQVSVDCEVDRFLLPAQEATVRDDIHSKSIMELRYGLAQVAPFKLYKNRVTYIRPKN